MKTLVVSIILIGLVLCVGGTAILTGKPPAVPVSQRVAAAGLAHTRTAQIQELRTMLAATEAATDSQVQEKSWYEMLRRFERKILRQLACGSDGEC